MRWTIDDDDFFLSVEDEVPMSAPFRRDAYLERRFPFLRRLQIPCCRALFHLTGATSWVTRFDVVGAVEGSAELSGMAYPGGRIALLRKDMEAIEKAERTGVASDTARLANSYAVILHEMLHLSGSPSRRSFVTRIVRSGRTPGRAAISEGLTELTTRQLLPSFLHELHVDVRFPGVMSAVLPPAYPGSVAYVESLRAAFGAALGLSSAELTHRTIRAGCTASVFTALAADLGGHAAPGLTKSAMRIIEEHAASVSRSGTVDDLERSGKRQADLAVTELRALGLRFPEKVAREAVLA